MQRSGLVLFLGLLLGIQTTLSRYLLVEIEARSPSEGGRDGEPLDGDGEVPIDEPYPEDDPEDPNGGAPVQEPYPGGDPLDGPPGAEEPEYGPEEGTDPPGRGEEQEAQGGTEGNGEPEEAGDKPPEKPNTKGKTKGRIFDNWNVGVGGAGIKGMRHGRGNKN